jgi:23S rRNA pseudouridine2605 synthase
MNKTPAYKPSTANAYPKRSAPIKGKPTPHRGRAPIGPASVSLQENATWRLNRVIALSGKYSRREADALILAGKVRLHGKIVTELSTKVNPKTAKLTVKGVVLTFESFKYEYVLYYKTTGYITTKKDDLGRPTIFDRLPKTLAHLDPAGRLDRKSSGLLLLTNDGKLLHQLTHPSHAMPKGYRVTVAPNIKDPNTLANALLEGVWFEEEQALAKVNEVLLLEKDTLQLQLTTGYNRQIRRMLEKHGYEVTGLKRLYVGGLRLGQLKPGEFRYLKPAEITALRATLKL